MANAFSKFSQEHHYASGMILVTVGVVGLVGSITGELANMLAALWIPNILATSSGGSAASGTGGALGTANSIANTILKDNPITGPTTWIESLLP